MSFEKMENLSDSNLVCAALAGEVESFGQLCLRYYSRLYAIAYSVLADQHLAEDAAQEALAVACRKLRNLRKPDTFGCWVGTICRNVARDMARKRKQDRELVLDCIEDYKDSPDGNSISISMGNGVVHPTGELASFVRQLPEGMREVIYLRYSHDLTYSEIGLVLGISEEAVNGRLRRAKKKLVRMMERLDKNE